MGDAPETNGPQEAASNPDVLSVGATLRAAREAQGLTVADVAERVKFSVRQVEALEADDMPHLPPGAFLRGFIRSYARVLHLDEAALLAVMPPKSEPRQDVAEAQAGGVAFPLFESARKKSIYLLVGALLIALLLAVFVWSDSGNPPPANTVVEEVSLPEAAPASAPLAVLPPALSAVPAAASAVVPLAVSAPVPVAALPPAPKIVAVMPPKVVQPVAASSVAGKPLVPLEELKKRPVHIVFLGTAWMEVTDKNGEVLLSLTGTAGSEKWVGGRQRAPYQVSVGKAAAVRIYYRGREVDLAQYKQDGPAKLVLE